MRNPFAPRPAPPVAPELASALADLERLGRDRPELAGPAAVLGSTLRAAFAAGVALPRPLDLPALTQGWAQGVPAFQVAAPALDPLELTARLNAIGGSLHATHPGAPALVAALRAGRLDPLGWAGEVLAGRPEAVGTDARRLGLDPDLAASAFRLALLPPLAAASLILDRVRPESTWARGDCPHCGGPPLLAESRGLEQRRHLRCGLCAADWTFDRLRCPSCGEADHEKLRYLQADDDGDRYRVDLCDSCGYALRRVSTLGPLPPPALLVIELATAHLDAILP